MSAVSGFFILHERQELICMWTTGWYIDQPNELLGWDSSHFYNMDRVTPYWPRNQIPSDQELIWNASGNKFSMAAFVPSFTLKWFDGISLFSFAKFQYIRSTGGSVIASAIVGNENLFVMSALLTTTSQLKSLAKWETSDPSTSNRIKTESRSKRS